MRAAFSLHMLLASLFATTPITAVSSYNIAASGYNTYSDAYLPDSSEEKPWHHPEQVTYSSYEEACKHGPWHNANDYEHSENGHNGNGNGHNGNGNGHNGNGNSDSNHAAGNTGNSYTNGAGVRAKGETTIYVGYTAFQTDHFFNEEGDKKPTGSVIYQQLYTTYIEYGLTEYDTLLANFNYVRIRQTETLHPNINGLRDFDLGWKRLLWAQKNDVFSVTLLVTIPSGSNADELIAVRAGQFAELVAFQYSHEFTLGCRPAGFDLSVGYRFYQGFPSDAVVLGTGFRYEFLKNFLFIASLDLYDGVGNGRPVRIPGPGASAAELEEFIDDEINNITIRNSRFLSGALYLCYTFSHVTATIGTYRNLWGRNVGAQTAYFGGLTFAF